MQMVDFDRLIKNLKLRNIDAEYISDFNSAKEKILNVIPNGCSVGIGHSATLEKMNISSELLNKGCTVYDKTRALTKEESRMLKKKSLLADWYVTGTNAISMEGHIVNVDHSGNRAAAMVYGPDKVIIIAGINKISENLEKAVERVKNIACPMNAKRAGFNPPCTVLNKCIDCKSAERVCNYLLIIEGQMDSSRMKVFIVGEDAGF